jgi:glycosyltransferase involved in cell wall biosynthesis
LSSLSIVIPAYNEKTRLPTSLDSVLSYLSQQPWSPVELIVVDDGSTDGTEAVVEEYRKEHPQVRLLSNPGNRGKGYAVRRGMLDAKGDWVLFSDADLSAPIEELGALVAAAGEHNADVVIGSRALDRSLIGMHQSRFRENAGRLFNLAMRLIVGLPFWDTQCGFKLFASKAASEVFRRTRLDGFGFDVEALFVARKLGFRVVEVPVRWNHVAGTKVSMFRDSAGMFLDLLRVRVNQMRGWYG